LDWGSDTLVKQVKVTWPDGKIQVLNNVGANQVLTIDKNKLNPFAEVVNNPKEYLLKDITYSLQLNYSHTERDYIDDNIQITIVI